MKHRTGVLPKDYKHLNQSKTNSEDLKELARTILAAIVMVIAIGLGFFAAATVSEPQAQESITRKGGGQLVGSHPVAARRQSHP